MTPIIEQQQKLERVRQALSLHFPKVANEKFLKQYCAKRIESAYQQMQQYLLAVQQGKQLLPPKFPLLTQDEIPKPEMDMSETSIIGNEKFYLSKYKAEFWNKQITPLNLWLTSLQNFGQAIDDRIKQHERSNPEILQFAQVWLATFSQIVPPILAELNGTTSAPSKSQRKL